MKNVRGAVLVVFGLLILVTAMLLLRHNRHSREELTSAAALPSEPKAQAVAPDSTKTNPPKQAQEMPLAIKSFTTRVADMSPEERSKLARDFEEKYKPAATRWFNAFSGRVPFDGTDFTLDKFHSRLGSYMYTFMIGDTTFTIQDSPQGIKVSYMMTRDGARQLNSMPAKGSIPNLSTPVTKEEVIRMVKADSGVEFKRSEVIIIPSGASSALGGGAIVHIVPTGANPNNPAQYKMEIVFGPDGKLINYARNPGL